MHNQQPDVPQPIRQQPVTTILIQHFFRRFFDNDTIQVDGETLTTVIRAAAATAVPGLMVAFFLQNQYPRRTMWGSIEDQYFFVLFSFVVIGLIAVFEWEMLFPDRLDFLILSPLSLRPVQTLAAKAVALAAFLTLFLVSSNLLGTIMLPSISHYAFFRHLLAHLLAVLLAGIFSSFCVLALGGILLCILDETRFRIVAPFLQAAYVLVLVLLLLQYAQYGDSMESWLAHPTGIERWLPPVWFLAVYEHLLRGDAAPAFARELTPYALRGTAIAGLLTLLTYPLAWARVRKMAVEGSSHQRRQRSQWLADLAHQVVQHPGGRAVFHFIGQTMARNNRYQVYLAMYCGTGLAIALACVVHLQIVAGTLQPKLSGKGLHAVMPLLLFWAIAGLRTAFGFPLNLPAGWVFRCTGVSMRACAQAARHWVLAGVLGVMAAVLAALACAGWSPRRLLVQAIWGLCLSVVLSDAFFFFQHRVPFTQPRMPGRTSFPLMLTLFAGVFPAFIFAVIYAEAPMEKNLWKLLPLVLVSAAIHATLTSLSRGYEEIDEEMEGYEGEFQLLNLS